MFIFNNYDKIIKEIKYTKDGINILHCKIDKYFTNDLPKYIERKNVEKQVIEFRKNYDTLINGIDNEKIRSKKDILRQKSDEFIKTHPNVSKLVDKRSYNSFISEIESFEFKYNNIKNVHNLNDDSLIVFELLINTINDPVKILTSLEFLRNENIKLNT